MVFFSLSFFSAVSRLASGQIPWGQQSSRLPKVSKCETARVSGHSGSFLRLRDWRGTGVSLVEKSLVIANQLQQWRLGKVRRGPPTCRQCICYMFPTCHLTRQFSLEDILKSIELSPCKVMLVYEDMVVTAVMPSFLFLHPWWTSLRTKSISHHLLLPDLENIIFFFTSSSRLHKKNTCYLKYHHLLLSGILYVCVT